MLRQNHSLVSILAVSLLSVGLLGSSTAYGGGKREPTLQEEGARYLIITHDNFYASVLPLAQWKHKKGMMAKVVKLSDIGSSPYQIREYIRDAYLNWPIRPEYLLLVGDTEYLPTYHSITYTDNYYGDVDIYDRHVEADYLPEIVVGRFSVDSPSHCETMVSKTLGYERTPWLQDVDWFLKATLIVRDDYDSGDSIYYNDTWYIYDLMSNGGYTWIDTLFRKNGANASDVIAAVNDGRTFVNYRGTGVRNWWNPFWVNPYIATNGFKLPIVVSATCGTGSFHDDGFVGEDWVRAGTSGSPRGAVGFFGSNTVGSGQYLSHLRSAVDLGFFRSIFVDSVSTLGGACLGGKLNLYLLYHDQKEYEGWNLLGDPELNLWTSTPETLSVDHPSNIMVGPNDFPVNVTDKADPIENALVCVVMDTSIYEYGYTDQQGEVTFSIAPAIAGTLSVTVTAHNYLPYEGECLVVVTGVEEVQGAGCKMQDARLYQNYPNPFTAVTSVQFSLRPEASGPRAVPSGFGNQHASLRVYDISGRKVKTLVDGTFATDHHRGSGTPPRRGLPLTTEVVWDGRDEEGRLVASGTYFYQLKCGSLVATRKLIVLR